MRLQERNITSFYYANYIGKKELIDEEGNRTGQYEVVRTKPAITRGNVSGNFGRIEMQRFGGSFNYDKRIALEDYNVPIDEFSVLWVEVDPMLDEEGYPTVGFDYVVTKTSRTINYYVVAIQKVTVNEN